MKRIYTLIAVLAALGTTMSCTMREFCPPVGENDVFYGRIAETESTKAFIDGLKIKWQDSDCVRINGVEYKAEVDGSDPAHAKFKPADSTPSTEDELYKAVFPSSLYRANTSAHYELPSDFDYDSKRFDIPMYAESSSNELLFISMFVTLKVCLPDEYLATSLSVSSDLYLNGMFTINTSYLGYGDYVQAEMLDGTDNNKTTTVHFNSDVAGADVYVSIPSNTYSGKNLKFTLTCSDGSKIDMTTNQSADINLLAGTLYTFNFRRDGSFEIVKEGEIKYQDIL